MPVEVLIKNAFKYLPQVPTNPFCPLPLSFPHPLSHAHAPFQVRLCTAQKRLFGTAATASQRPTASRIMILSITFLRSHTLSTCRWRPSR